MFFFHHNNHTQATVNHPRTINNQASHCFAHLLAQARGSRSDEPIRLGEGSKRGTVASRGISLRRDPSRMGETLLAWARCSLAQKGRGSPEQPFA
ncbi:hypothetical protein DEO72_LG11g1708 [Vigna unguiculata]|nr:hypothetical protein DEO72_LG11g1708 [Vigna unguiculata]